MRDGSGSKRPLPVATNTQNGAVGEASFHPHPASASRDAAATVPVRD